MDFSSIPILATAISIVISWALFAILCSLVHELFAQLKSERGRFMKKYLTLQLQDTPNGVNWATMLYMHGTVDLLSRSENKPTSDINPHLFAETLVEVVGNAHLVPMQLDTVPEANAYTKPSLYHFKAATQVLLPSDVVSFMKQSLSSAEMKATDEAGVYRELIQNIEAWYCDLLSRLNLWYKKKTRVRLFLLGIVLGGILNIDSIELFKHFNAQPSSRAAMMGYYEKNASSLSAMATKLDNPYLPDSAKSGLKEVAQQSAAYARQLDSLAKEADLPLGWSNKNKDTNDHSKGMSFGEIMLKILGILISGFAASFGAPFWFELLKKIYSKN